MYIHQACIMSRIYALHTLASSLGWRVKLIATLCLHRYFSCIRVPTLSHPLSRLIMAFQSA